jgi:hypothetical protein
LENFTRNTNFIAFPINHPQFTRYPTTPVTDSDFTLIVPTITATLAGVSQLLQWRILGQTNHHVVYAIAAAGSNWFSVY